VYLVYYRGPKAESDLWMTASLVLGEIPSRPLKEPVPERSHETPELRNNGARVHRPML
jgi:hypothetical protein